MNMLSTILLHLTALVARLSLGQAFLVAGWYKLTHQPEIIGQFTGWGVPMPQILTPVVGSIELIGGGLLVLGLGTRWAALALVAVMIGALTTAHLKETTAAVTMLWPAPGAGVTAISAWMFALVLLWLSGWGGGAFALDRLIFGAGGAKKKPAGDGEKKEKKKD